MEYREYIFKGKINFHTPGRYVNLHNQIREFFPKNQKLKIGQEIDSFYGKGKEKARVEMRIKILSESSNENIKIKEKLEEILGGKLSEVELK